MDGMEGWMDGWMDGGACLLVTQHILQKSSVMKRSKIRKVVLMQMD